MAGLTDDTPKSRFFEQCLFLELNKANSWEDYGGVGQ